MNTEPVLAPIFGTIRRNPDATWSVLNDATHKSLGIGAVELYPTDPLVLTKKALKVWFTDPATFVGTFVATPDETSAKADLHMGATVGLEFAYIYIYQGSSMIPCDPQTITNPSANIWIVAYNWISTTT